MSVTHKKSEKQIGAAELEALRASIMAEVEAARAELRIVQGAPPPPAPKPKKALFRVSAITLFPFRSKAKSGTRRKAISRATW